jgi:hypothetical protein
VASESGAWWLRWRDAYPCGRWFRAVKRDDDGCIEDWEWGHKEDRTSFPTRAEAERAARTEYAGRHNWVGGWKHGMAIMRPKRRAAVPCTHARWSSSPTTPTTCDECGIDMLDVREPAAPPLTRGSSRTESGGFVFEVEFRDPADGGNRASVNGQPWLGVAADCPCNTDVDEPGPHIPSCPWNDPDYVAPLPPELRALAADPARREAYNNLRIPARELLRWAAAPWQQHVIDTLEHAARRAMAEYEVDSIKAALALLRAAGASK